MRVVTFKCDEEDYYRWRREALDARITWGEWVRRKLNGGVPAAPTMAEIAVTRVRPCDHRLPPGTYCKRCKVLKK